MLVDALASVSEDLPEVPEGESVRDSLVALVDTIRSSTQDTAAGRLLPRVMASVQQYPEVIDEYRARVVEPAGAERGDARQRREAQRGGPLGAHHDHGGIDGHQHGHRLVAAAARILAE